MIHRCEGKMLTEHGSFYLMVGAWGVEVSYHGSQTTGIFYLHPSIDDTNKTIRYFCFDTYKQKELYLRLVKISGVGPKTAFNITAIPVIKLQEAIDSLDLSVLQAIPGIGPKTAKKLMVELQETLDSSKLTQITQNPELTAHITKALHTMGYDKQQVQQLLPQYPGEFIKANTQNIIIRTLQQLSNTQ